MRRRAIHRRLAATAAVVVALAAGRAVHAQHAAHAQSDGATASAWWQAAAAFQSEHYNVRSDLNEPISRELAAHMDRMYEHYGRVLSGLRTRRTLRFDLLLFNTQEDYNGTLSSRYDAKPMGTGGMCVRERGQVTLAVWRGGRPLEQVKQVLQHEGFHQVARSLLGDIPVWADEGLAEICEAAVLLDGRVIFGEVRAPYVAMLREADRRGALMSLTDLFKIDGERWTDAVNAGRGQLQYAQAWSVVHFLLFADNARHQPAFERFLGALNNGQSWESAFVHAFKTSNFESMERPWRDHLASMEPTDLRETIRRLDFLAAGMAALREKGTQPATLADLKSALKEAGFTHTCRLFDDARVLKASEDKSFIVPVPRVAVAADEPADEGAVFELVAKSDTTKKGASTRSPAPARQRGGAQRDRKPDPAPVKKPDETDPKPATGPKSGGQEKSPAPPAAPPADPASPPPVITTRGLKPIELEVLWHIDKKSSALTYEIVTR